jgi:oxaloacetate decarboxylase beta subunit
MNTLKIDREVIIKMDFFGIIEDLYLQSSFDTLTIHNIIMIAVSLLLIYLAIRKEYEPLLLLPIAFGMLLVNLSSGIMGKPVGDVSGGLLYYLSQGNKLGIFPPLVFLGVGALTDFGPLLANPKSFLLGAAAQFGIFFAFLSAVVIGLLVPSLGITGSVAAAIGIIGGADGPTAIYVASMLAEEHLPAIAVAAYSYMAMVPIIQPPIMRMFTTKKERAIRMEQLRPVSKLEKIIFPILVAVLVIGLLPETAPLVGMLMFGNLIKESGVVRNLVETASNALMYIIVIFLGLAVGGTAEGANFLNATTLAILALGLVAFCIGTATGVLFGKLMSKFTGGKVNPLIGAAGVSAVPMAARIVQKVGREENPDNFLLMHAMGPNVAGVIGSAVAAGVFLTIFGG